MHVTKSKYTRRVQVYEPEVNGKYYKVILGYGHDAWHSYWPGKYIRKTSKRGICIYSRKGQLIGDVNIDLTGVDMDGDKNEAQLKYENDNDLDYQ